MHTTLKTQSDLQGSFFRMVFCDIKASLFLNLPAFALALLCFAFLSFDLSKTMRGVELLGISPLDYLLCFYSGIPTYHPESNQPFPLPIKWLMPQIIVSFSVARYACLDSSNNGLQMISRAGSRRRWWLSKCLTTVLTVLIIYGIAVLVSITASAVTGGFLAPFEATGLTSSIGYTIDIEDEIGLAKYALLAPVLVSIALSLLQLSFTLALGPTAGFAAILTFLIVSVYFDTPALLGDYSMIARCSLVESSGTPFYTMIIMCLGTSLASAALGRWLLKRLDLLPNRNHQ